VAFNGGGIELAYEVLTSNGRGVYFSHLGWNATDVYYVDNCYNSRNLFGCAGLKSAEYCILNKAYSKEEYQALMSNIIEYMKTTGEWGQFFPKELSPFAYNESIINEYYPLKREEALGKGYRWKEDLPSTSGQETVSHDVLPKDPQQFGDELLKHVLKCDTCGKNYRFIPQEINFYKRLGLLLPRECFNCRHQRRMNMRNPRKLFDGLCANCKTPIQTSYSPEQQKEFRIYCESCYQSDVG